MSMATTDLYHHTSRRFNEELERVRSKVLSMGGLVEAQLGKCLAALAQGQGVVGQSVVAGERQVNAMEVSIDEDCIRILATRGPAAGDLRLIIATIKTITDLERIGDECEKIGMIAPRLALAERSTDGYRAVRHLGRAVQSMVHDALDACARLDWELALRTARADRLVDEEYKAIRRQCVSFMLKDPQDIPRALDVMWIVRALERIGDHAKNVCEYVIYVVHGQDIRHLPRTDLEHWLVGSANSRR